MRLSFGFGRLEALERLKVDGIDLGAQETFLGILTWCLGIGLDLKPFLYALISNTCAWVRSSEVDVPPGDFLILAILERLP